MYKEKGRLPVWELGACETNCMIGYHAASVITDAWAKGIRGFDSSLALEAMLAIANENQYGKHEYVKYGFIPSEKEPESVSKTLEYAYDDWCISAFAGMIGNDEIAQEFRLRSYNWRNLFDPETGFMRPRFNGTWLIPFDPREVNNHFTEANCWQYSLYVPHDIRDHMVALGGMIEYTEMLDGLFADSSGTTGREQSDITGLIGQYAHGNEPSHHIAYLYNYAFEPWKAQDIIHRVCTEFYTNSPDGLIGNEDCGQMSAWYVLSALGLYQVTPGNPTYALGTPALDKATVHLENGTSIVMNTTGREAGNYYSTAKLDGNVVAFVEWDELKNGNTLLYNLSHKPAENATDYLLPNFSESIITPPATPLIDVPRSFRGNAVATVTKLGNADRIFYFLDGDSLQAKLYTGPVELRKTSIIHAFAVSYDGISTLKSKVSVAESYKVQNDWKVTLNSKYNTQYSAGGPEALVDGIHGTVNWRAGDWQGYQNTDFEAVVDLGTATSLAEIGATFLQDQRSWILYPTAIDIYFSSDGQNWVAGGTVKNTVSTKTENAEIQEIKLQLKNRKTSRFIKIVAHNYGKLPAWHAGAGMDGHAFIFVDEIVLR